VAKAEKKARSLKAPHHDDVEEKPIKENENDNNVYKNIYRYVI